MPAYLVTLDLTKGGRNLVAGANAMVVFAASATAAKQAAAAKFDGEGAAWIDDGTATEIAAASTWIGWTFVVTLSGGISVSLTATGSGQDTIDEIAAALVVLLNATAINGAAYNSTTQVLTVAAAADGLGAQRLTVQIIPPDGKSSVDSLVGTIVDEGSAAADVTVVLPADAAVIPSVPVALIQT